MLVGITCYVAYRTVERFARNGGQVADLDRMDADDLSAAVRPVSENGGADDWFIEDGDELTYADFLLSASEANGSDSADAVTHPTEHSTARPSITHIAMLADDDAEGGSTENNGDESEDVETVPVPTAEPESESNLQEGPLTRLEDLPPPSLDDDVDRAPAESTKGSADIGQFGLTAPITDERSSEADEEASKGETAATDPSPVQRTNPFAVDAEPKEEDPSRVPRRLPSGSVAEEATDTRGERKPRRLGPEPREKDREKRDDPDKRSSDDNEELSDDETSADDRSVPDRSRDEIVDAIDPLDNNRITLEGPAWDLTLPQAIAVALRHSPDIDVANYEPLIDAAVVMSERGAFDPVGGMSFYGGQDDRLARSLVETFSAPVDFQDQDFFTPLSGLNNLYVRQQLKTGAQYEFGFGTDYRRFDPVGLDLLLPSGWESSINFQITQPLARGFGRDATLQRLRIAQAETQRSQYETAARVREQVREVELLYWQLSSAHARVLAASKYLELGAEFEEQEDQRRRLGLSARPQQLQTRALLSDFRVSLELARRDANIAEMRLRTAMGIAGTLLRRDCDVENIAMMDLPIRPDISGSVTPLDTDVYRAAARSQMRPVYGAVRARIAEANANLAAARNRLLPEIDATALYRKTGLDKSLDESWDSLWGQRFETWAVGLTYQQSAYRRPARGQVLRFRRTLQQNQTRLLALDNEIQGELRRYKQDVEGSYETFDARRAQVKFLTMQLEAFSELYKDDKISLFQRLEITRALQAAEIEAVEAWGRMQQANAQFRFTRGDLPGDYGIDVDGVMDLDVCGCHSALVERAESEDDNDGMLTSEPRRIPDNAPAKLVSGPGMALSTMQTSAYRIPSGLAGPTASANSAVAATTASMPSTVPSNMPSTMPKNLPSTVPNLSAINGPPGLRTDGNIVPGMLPP